MSVVRNASLQDLNTFGIACRCAALADFDSAERLASLLRMADGPVFILGGGSNILLPDMLDRWVLHNRIGGISLSGEAEGGLVVSAGGGVIWHDLVLWTVGQGLAGLENLALIPGTVGAAPIQNIGAYGVELRERFLSLTALERETGCLRVFDRQECAFGYRDSIFKQGERDRWVILSVDLRLSGTPNLNLDYGDIRQVLADQGIADPGIREVMDAVIAIRQAKLPDPARTGNAGSFFKNPVVSADLADTLRRKYPDLPLYPAGSDGFKVPAGWLIDRAGWKGARRGNAGVHDRQALVLVNHGGATAAEVRGLAEEIRNDILETYGIDLETEVNIL